MVVDDILNVGLMETNVSKKDRKKMLKYGKRIERLLNLISPLLPAEDTDMYCQKSDGWYKYNDTDIRLILTNSEFRMSDKKVVELLKVRLHRVEAHHALYCTTSEAGSASAVGHNE